MHTGERNRPQPRSDFRHRDESGATVVLCAGLKSSGSTWLYNAVIQLCERSYGPKKKNHGGVVPFYADEIKKFPVGADSADVLIIKTHDPSPSLAFLGDFLSGTVFVTVREPRDAVASVIRRFGHEFGAALEEIGRSAARLVQISDSARPVIFRYEEGFFRRPATVSQLGRQMGLALSPTAVRQTYNSLTADSVKRKISTLARKGAFGVRRHPDSFDAKTQWHPGHVGDGRVGKYAEILSPKMQQQVLCATLEYCVRFGYQGDTGRLLKRP